jgi:hypothetical protein
MLRKSFLATVLFASTAVFGAPPDEQTASIDHASPEMRGQERVVWLRNLAPEPASVELFQDSVRLERVDLAAGATARAQGTIRGTFLLGRGTGSFVMLEAPADAAGTDFDVYRREAGVGAPGWAALSSSAPLAAGARALAMAPVPDEAAGASRLSAIVSLTSDRSAVSFRVSGDARVYSVAGAEPAMLRVDLGPISERGARTVEFEVLAGEAVAALAAVDAHGDAHGTVMASSRSALAGNGGFGYYSATYSTNTIYKNTPAFTYKVTGAPPSICGDILTTRNGVLQITANWICTDSLGNATKGPWTCSANQTDIDTFIRWHDASDTSHSNHICDQSVPTVHIDAPTSTPPRVFTGTATDAAWGTGFDQGPVGWTNVAAYFRDMNTGLFYSSSSGCYCSQTQTSWYGGISPIVGSNVRWTVTPPPPSAHVAGHQYQWTMDKINDLFYATGASFAWQN